MSSEAATSGSSTMGGLSTSTGPSTVSIRTRTIRTDTMVLRTIRLRTTLLLGGSATARRDHVPYGLAGGRAGTPSRNVLNPGTEERELPAKCTLTVRSGDVYRHELAGAGGWGDPFARDPERVLRDVMEEKISPAYARREDGVVIDERTWTVVPEETARLRAAAQTAR